MRKNRYVVVDLEATSTGTKAKIIQVGIVVIEDGSIVTRYETDVNPHEPLDSHIQELTGLSDKRLAAAPDFSQVAKRIFDLVKDGIFVAHNVQFDANLLAEALFFEGYELRTPRVDTVELAQVLFPSLERYNLGVLCEELGIVLEQAHTALSDAQATAELLLRLREKLFQLPKALLARLLDLSDSLLYESYLPIQEVYQEQSLFVRQDLQEVHGIFLKKEEKFLKKRALSRDFAENRQALGLDERDLQEQFAQEVTTFLEAGETAFIQAPTGIGKTYGYLLPALAISRQKRLLVSVPTKILQNQIMAQEGRLLYEGFHISFHSLKGPQNYLKLDSLFQVLEKQDSNRLFTRFKMQLLVWLTETESGDLDEIGQLYRYQHFLADLVHDGTLSQKSLFASVDFWQKGQEKAKQCQVLVTNHAYLVTRLEDDPSLLEGRLLILDEAQKMLDTLEGFSQRTFSLSDLSAQVGEELQKEQDILTKRLLEGIAFECQYLLEQAKKQGQRQEDTDSFERLHQHFLELGAPRWSDWVRFLDQEHDLWLEGRGEEARLCSSKKERLVFSSLLPDSCQVLGLSATLEISSKVSLVDLLGFPKAPLALIESPKKAKQTVLVLKDFPPVTETSLLDYAAEVVAVLSQLRSFQKPVLVLFTAKDLLLAVSDLLDFPHLAQYKNGDVSQLQKRFEKGEQQFLLGTGSFWEGVDLSSHQTVVQVLPRLPFQSPEEQLTRKINDQLRREGKNPFYDYQLPMAIVRLKQALGRSLRRQDQASLVLVLDKRLTSKRYGKSILASLSKLAHVEAISKKEIKEKVKSSLTNHDEDRKKEEK